MDKTYKIAKHDIMQAWCHKTSGATRDKFYNSVKNNYDINAFIAKIVIPCLEKWLSNYVKKTRL